MNFRQLLITSATSLLLSGFIGVAPASAQDDPIVESAYPDSAIQGTYALEVEIRGSNLGRGAKVTFHKHQEGDGFGDSAPGITVSKVKAMGSSRLIVTMDVASEAYVGFTDIQVFYSSSRKGKGTSKFEVQAKPNQEETVSCEEVFFPGEPLICDCMFEPPREHFPYYVMQKDCHTSATLTLNGSPIRSNASAIPGGLEMSTLTAVPGADGTFHGSSVISNATERVGVRYLNIRFDPAVVRGCAVGELNSAISFVLDGVTDNPAVNSMLTVSDVTIDTNDPKGLVDNDPLCTAIEFLRFTPVITGGNFDAPQVFVQNVTIAEGSYEKFGINFEGMQPGGSLTEYVSGNYIGAPDCIHKPDTAAIQFGRIMLTDPTDPSIQNPGLVKSNIIRMENSNCLGVPVGVGIRVVGEPFGSDRIPADGVWPQTIVEVVKNVISGAMVGVEVEDDVLDINFSGNTLIGDPDDTSDIGICSDARSTSTKGKPNVWSGYFDDDHEILYAPCL